MSSTSSEADIFIGHVALAPHYSPGVPETAQMGSGDEIILSDAHFPGHSFNARVLRADGVGCEAL